jgi:hypothetical protein
MSSRLSGTVVRDRAGAQIMDWYGMPSGAAMTAPPYTRYFA